MISLFASFAVTSAGGSNYKVFPPPHEVSFTYFAVLNVVTWQTKSVGERNVTDVVFTKMTKVFVQDLLLGRCLLVATNHDNDLKDVTGRAGGKQCFRFVFIFHANVKSFKDCKKIVETLFCNVSSANSKHIAHRHMDYLFFGEGFKSSQI